MNTHHRLALIASGLVIATGAQANLLTNGDFESQPNWGINGDGSYTRLAGNELPGWTIESGHAVTIHNHGYPWISGTYSVNMDGEGFNGNNANLYQDFGTSLSVGYKLDFDWSGWFNSAPGTRLDVSVTDLTTNSVVAHGAYDFIDQSARHETFAFAGTGNSMRLRVQEIAQSGFNDNKFIVDNFSVEAVPEPASLAALALGAGFLIRKRRR